MTPRPIDSYLSSVGSLWPGAPEPRSHRDRGSGRARGPEAARPEGPVELIVLPSARQPRLLVPASNRAAAAGAMLRFSAALSVQDTVRRLGVAGLLRAGAGGAFPDRISVAERPGSLRSHLADVLGEPVDLSLGLGTARANRKPVLQAFDRRGRSLAFVKVGGTPVSDELVRAEAAALRRLGEATLPPALEVPRLLHAGEWQGAAVVVMTALDTSFRQRPARQFTVPEPQMQAFHAAFGEDPRPLEEMPLWSRLRAGCRRLSPSTERERLETALAAVADLAAGRPLAAGAWHGDWTPWNMSRRGGRLQLWDWERFETGTPPGLDRCHYGVNAVVRRDGLSTASVVRGLGLAGITGDSGPADRLAAATYLAAITTRYLAGAETDLGAVVEERSRVMLEALCSWLGLSSAVRHG